MKKIRALLFMFISSLVYCAEFEDRDEDFFNIHSALLPLQQGGDQSLDSRFMAPIDGGIAVSTVFSTDVFEGQPLDLGKFNFCRYQNCFERFSTIENQEKHEINIHGQLYLETDNFSDRLNSVEHSLAGALAVAADAESMVCSVESQLGQNRCDFCKVDYKSPSKLKEHIRVHIGENSFSCRICSRSFSKKSILTRHMANHFGDIGDRRFDCPHCDASFKLKSSLTKHIRIHTGESCFHCERCDSSFPNNGNLRVHKKIMHGE
jgi:hypothetical protein